MSNNSMLAINFEYTLMEFYKKLSLNETDVAVIFMIKHLLEQKNTLITADLLSLKMKLSVTEIDKILVNLLGKKYIAYVSTSKGLTTTLSPLEEKLSIMYQREIIDNLNKETNEENDNAKKNIYEVFEKELGRSLSPIEFSLIDEWINNGYKESIIMEAVKEAIAKHKLTLKNVDRILLQWQARDDIESEGHSAISSNWNKNINKTIDIAQKKWGDNNEDR